MSEDVLVISYLVDILGRLDFFNEVKGGGLYLGERECAGEALGGEEEGKTVVRMQYTRKKISKSNKQITKEITKPKMFLYSVRD